MIIREIGPEDTWPVRQIVMWPEKPIEFVKIKEDDEGVHYGLYKDDKLVSVISCFELYGQMQFRKFATLKEHQKQGLGTYLLDYIVSNAKKKGVKKIWCNARVDKKSYYEKFGFRDTNKTFFKEGIEFTIMELLLY